ncbi:MAG: DUF169 domain-containing protein [Oscillospiraceae bacterium]|nr:DUF169 domain-containing protein [Oscillospiraceae bacterium]
MGRPDLVYLFLNPDQLSALIIQLGFHNGKAVNAIAPQCSACQSILYAADQIDRPEPHAVLGLFDISQRPGELAGLLSMTMPYVLWEDMSRDLEKSCFTTHAWREIEKRL